LIDVFLILVVVIPLVFLSLWWALRPLPKKSLSAPETSIEILFRDGLVEHATENALSLLPITIGAHNWQDLYEILHSDFPDFPKQPHDAHSPDTIVAGYTDQNQQIQIAWRANSISLKFEETDTTRQNTSDSFELIALRQVSSLSLHPAWKTDNAGAIVWSNDAFKDLAGNLPEAMTEPAKAVFDLHPFSSEPSTSRVKLDIANSDLPEWFDVARTQLEDGVVYQATSLTALIRAEDAQRDFVQTLAKTFAHLSIGLAIFNRNRQLALFNPALIDLTGLSVAFLSPRPTIDSFFDALRENRRMPEPKNYTTWRHRMVELISQAETGRFEETWTLETGQTYNVKGRPHPDGAIAFLIEDISAEISLTRNFRAELELGQSLVDTFEDALAVFSQSGVLTFSNKAYDLLWGFQFDTSFADVTICDAVQLWKEKSAPNPLWQELQDAVMSLDGRENWDMPVSIKGQHPMNCKVVPIASGATVIRFSRQAAANSPRLPITSKSVG
jgi:PAS domain-containing protein